MKKWLIIILFLALITTSLSGVAIADQKKSITLPTWTWPGITVKNEIHRQLLETIGYDVTVKTLQHPMTAKALSKGDAECYLSAWMPMAKEYLGEYLEDGSVVKVVPHLDEAVYTLAVPQYVWDAGVHSSTDLSEHADKFDMNGDGKPEIYGIEPGNDLNQTVRKAIEDDTYGLSGWTHEASSTSGMLSQVEKATKNEDWIVFQGWKPHWMNIKHDIKYLEDPKQVWSQGGSTVWTVGRKGLKEDMPNLYKFLEQFKITATWQSAWIYEYGYEDRDVEEVAREWINNHLNITDLWFYGVETVDGESARKTIRKEYG